MAALPAVVEVLEERPAPGRATSGRKGSTSPAPSGWCNTGLPDRQRGRVRVAETAHAAQRAEVVVEGAVLLHEHDDVLDVADRAGAPVRGDGRGPGDAGLEHRGERREGGGPGRQLEEAAAVDRAHLGSCGGCVGGAWEVRSAFSGRPAASTAAVTGGRQVGERGANSRCEPPVRRRAGHLEKVPGAVAVRSRVAPGSVRQRSTEVSCCRSAARSPVLACGEAVCAWAEAPVRVAAGGGTCGHCLSDRLPDTRVGSAPVAR